MDKVISYGNLKGVVGVVTNMLNRDETMVRSEAASDLKTQSSIVMNQLVDVEQERLRLIDEVSELKELNASLKQEVADLRVIRVLLSHKLESIKGES